MYSAKIMIQSPGVEYTIFREKTSNEVELSSDQKELMKQIPSSKKITIQSSTSIKEDFAKNDFNTLIWIQSAIDVIAHTLEHQPNSIDELDIVIDFSQNKTDYSIPINWRHIERFSRYFSYLLIKINLLIKESNRMSHLRLNVHIGYPFKKDLIVQSDQWTIIQDILVSIPQSISTLNIAIDSILPEPHLSSYSMIIDTLSRLGQLDNLYLKVRSDFICHIPEIAESLQRRSHPLLYFHVIVRSSRDYMLYNELTAFALIPCITFSFTLESLLTGYAIENQAHQERLGLTDFLKEFQKNPHIHHMEITAPIPISLNIHQGITPECLESMQQILHVLMKNQNLLVLKTNFKYFDYSTMQPLSTPPVLQLAKLAQFHIDKSHLLSYMPFGSPQWQDLISQHSAPFKQIQKNIGHTLKQHREMVIGEHPLQSVIEKPDQLLKKAHRFTRVLIDMLNPKNNIFSVIKTHGYSIMKAKTRIVKTAQAILNQIYHMIGESNRLADSQNIYKAILTLSLHTIFSRPVGYDLKKKAQHMAFHYLDGHICSKIATYLDFNEKESETTKNQPTGLINYTPLIFAKRVITECLEHKKRSSSRKVAKHTHQS